MFRSRTAVRVAVALSAAVAGGVLAFEPAGSAGDPPPFRTDSFMTLNTRGMRENMSKDPMRTVYEFDIHSNLTGEKIGTATDSVFCSTTTPPPCQVFDAVTTFHLPDGEITNHAQVSVVPDPQRPGGFLVGARPTENSVVSGTGAYEGKKAKVRLTGWNDGSDYPNRLMADDWWIFEFEQ
ncbi:MAG TPA: hypothetical protein VEG38_22305 [Acidimicrobiia bacterium]|nr:hypothetical protein [Acidimicrobiia bacterium]